VAPQPFLPANPRWLPTFTVLLLAIVCMLVVMLSLSRPDYRRFALVSGELAAGFGNEDSLAGDPVPLGASVIVPDFHPDGEPSPIDKPWQGSGQLPPLELPVAAVPPAATPTPAPQPPGPTSESRALARSAVDALVAGARKQAGALAARFGGGISRGEVEIETRGRTVVLRLLEKGSFAPGSTILLPAMRKQLQDVASVVAAQPGPLVLRGHHAGAAATGPSDWTLSAGRAAAMAEVLQGKGGIDPDRLTVVAHGASRPLVARGLPRAERNTRVELVITQPVDAALRATLDMLAASHEELDVGVPLEQILDPPAAEVP
jgi:chemotaxis protein MotB